MSRNSLLDYTAYILFSLLGPLVRLLPRRCVYFAARRLGDLFYVFDLTHRGRVYAHLKAAFGAACSPSQNRSRVRSFYQAFGQNLAEVFLIPKVTEDYIRKFVTIHGREHIAQAFARGKGVIFVAVHAGPWEMANIICSHLGIPFYLFVGDLRLPRLEGLLMRYRQENGCRIIQRQDQLRKLMGIMKANESFVLTVDQGGRDGTVVPFFGKPASMSSGAVRLALKYDCTLLPVFPVRRRDQNIEFFVEPAFDLERGGPPEKEIARNLERLIGVFEKHIAKDPAQYLWTYKVWKYADSKNILILSDAKAGHLRQSQGLARIAAGYLQRKAIGSVVRQQEVVFKNRLASRAMGLAGALAGKYICQGCLVCLRSFISPDTYRRLMAEKPDIIISCGSSLAAVNYLLAREYQARSLVVMRPSILSTRRFDLVVMPRHDDPPRRRNVVVTEGALNLIDSGYLAQQKERLKQEAGVAIDPEKPAAGLLIGGDTKDFSIGAAGVAELFGQLQKVSRESGLQILATTSRRTPAAICAQLKRSAASDASVRLLVIASEKNYPSAVGGILAMSDILIVSAESISMVSEAAASGKYVLVFGHSLLGGRHRKFLDNLMRRGVVSFTAPETLAEDIGGLLRDRPRIKALDDAARIEEALGKLL